MATSRKSMEPNSNQLTLFAEGRHANPYPSPGSAEARRTTAGSGRKLCALLKSASPAGVFSRTLLESSIWASTEYLLTWKIKATKQRRLIFQLAESIPRRSDIDCGSWPTPTANKLTSNCADPNDLINSDGTPWKPGRKPHDRRTGKQVTTTLHDYVRAIWPMLASRDWKDGRALEETLKKNGRPLNEVTVSTWPTPRAGDGMNHPLREPQNIKGNGRGHLEDVMSLSVWPTPRANERGDYQCDGHDRSKRRPTLTGAVRGLTTNGSSEETEEKSGALNPEFVEWLQGFPIGWTDLER